MASRAGLAGLAEMIDICFDKSVAQRTLTIYQRVRRDFLEFIKKFRVPVSALHKLRNVFLAQLIDKGKTRSLGYHVAALSHFFGPLPGEDHDIQSSLIRMANRGSPPVKHRRKASQSDVDIVVAWALRLGTPEALTGAATILLMFSAFLRIGELCNLRFSDIWFKAENIWWLKYADQRQTTKDWEPLSLFGSKEMPLDYGCDSESSTRKIQKISFSAAAEEDRHPETSSPANSKGPSPKQASSTATSLPTHFMGEPPPQQFELESTPPNVMRVGRWKSQKSFLCYVEPSPL